MSAVHDHAPTGWRRLVAGATAREASAFVVPDARMARQAGLDLAAAGVRLAATPRHASVLLVIGDLPAGLVEAATVVYAQMPRPRALLALGAGTLEPLPAADVTAALDQAGLESGMARIREHLASDAWASPTEPFTAPVLEAAAVDDGGMDHSAHMHGGHGNMDHGNHAAMDHGDHGAMDHFAHAGHDNHDTMHHDEHAAMGHEDHVGMDHSSMDHSAHTGMDHGGHTHADHGQADAEHGTMSHGHESMEHNAADDDHEGIDHAAMGHDHNDMDHSAMGHDHGGMDHSAMGHDMSGGFMSMVAMTKDLPRSPDGLPMEWVEAPFGPLFPGLPAGLAPTLTLDGDTVARATLETGVVHRGVLATLPGPASSFPVRLAALDPLAPVSYRILAMRGLVAAGATAHDEAGWAPALRRERVASHLAWLAGFMALLGLDGPHDRAASLHLDLLRAPDVATVGRLAPRIDRLLRGVGRVPMLRRRLAGIGVLDAGALDGVSGPVARASADGGDAWARLQVRLEEIREDLVALQAARTLEIGDLTIPPHLSGSGMATVETPRGTASLHLEVAHGEVRVAHVMVPSSALAGLVPVVVEQAELADALVAIASLDLSPWEMDQ